MESSSGFGLRPRSIGELLDLTFRVYRRRFGVFAGIGIGISLAALAANLGWNAAVFSAMKSLEPDPAMQAGVMALATLPLLLAITLVFHVFGALAMTAVVEDALFGRPSGLKPALARAWPRFLPAVWTAILAFVPVLAGLLCCVAPGLVLSVLLIFSIYVPYLERISGLAAVRRSMELVARRGPSGFTTEANWVRVLAMGFVTIVIFYALSILASAPLLVIGFLQGVSGQPVHQTVLGPQPVPLWVFLPLSILGSLAQGALVPITMIPWPLLYYDIRTRHEGLDLEMTVQQLDAGADTTPSSLSREP